MREISPLKMIFRFAIVGGVGFCLDGGLLTILVKYGWDIFLARTCSFSIAVSSTWFFNRVWTFRSNLKPSLSAEYINYFLSQMIGAAINLSVFFVVIYLFPRLSSFPLIPLAFGAAISLVFNYLVSKHFVFEGRGYEQN